MRSRFGTTVLLGEGERAGFEDMLAKAPPPEIPQTPYLRRSGAPTHVVDALRRMGANIDLSVWTRPDGYVADGEVVTVGDARLTARHTPGHTQGHFLFHDLERTLMFTGDHVLPHITPSIGFEQIIAASPLRDYLASLELVRSFPDALLLPGHGPIGQSVHDRVDELIAHHGQRLDETLRAVDRGADTAYAIAEQLTWTSGHRRLGELDPFNTMLAVLETLWHAELLAERGHVQAHDVGEIRHFTR
ncbi:MAG: MBL fold metallo-hydrolase [Tetrasphaera sp.]